MNEAMQPLVSGIAIMRDHSRFELSHTLDHGFDKRNPDNLSNELTNEIFEHAAIMALG